MNKRILGFVFIGISIVISISNFTINGAFIGALPVSLFSFIAIVFFIGGIGLLMAGRLEDLTINDTLLQEREGKQYIMKKGTSEIYSVEELKELSVDGDNREEFENSFLRDLTIGYKTDEKNQRRYKLFIEALTNNVHGENLDTFLHDFDAGYKTTKRYLDLPEREKIIYDVLSDKDREQYISGKQFLNNLPDEIKGAWKMDEEGNPNYDDVVYVHMTDKTAAGSIRRTGLKGTKTEGPHAFFFTGNDALSKANQFVNVEAPNRKNVAGVKKDSAVIFRTDIYPKIGGLGGGTGGEGTFQAIFPFDLHPELMEFV